MKEYKFDSVQAFYKKFNAAKKEYFDYRAARAKWEKNYRDKVADSVSLRDQIKQMEQSVREREVGREHQKRQKDKGAR